MPTDNQSSQQCPRCSFLRETFWGGSQLSLLLRQIARNKILGPLVAVPESPCSSLFRKISRLPNRTFSVCFLVLSLVAVVLFYEAEGLIVGGEFRPIVQRVFSGANCACVCHFSYAYATCVNFVMFIFMPMLMSKCKPGFTACGGCFDL